MLTNGPEAVAFTRFESCCREDASLSGMCRVRKGKGEGKGEGYGSRVFRREPFAYWKTVLTTPAASVTA
jgi:hypothetical protein